MLPRREIHMLTIHVCTIVPAMGIIGCIYPQIKVTNSIDKTEHHIDQSSTSTIR